ncbi:histone-arginine methyltransferase CARM1-like [Styela clava]|uniref:histone-arginine methyltransferase CARM1-like n=1 Tax=Styela clava TaxID=7725 RepID=UPI00193ADDF5|nr:histone-arginine methyltransferase CARM1-like [Styela clava]
MAMTAISFENVVLSYLPVEGEEEKNNKGKENVKVDVKRVSEEALVTCLRSKDNTTALKCNVTRESDNCCAGKQVYLIRVHGDETVLLKFPSTDELCRFSSLVEFNSKSQSVFDRRTEDSSAVQYFQFYGYLSQQQNMMQDYIRTGTYQKAMLQNYINFRDKVVLDVGAGSGILSFFAMQAGARKVYAVEASTMAEYTKKLVQRSQYAGRIIVIPGKIEEIKLPEKVDVIVSEPMGYMLFNERMLETYLHAKKFLKQPNGMMFPTIGDLHIAPFSDEQLYMEQFTKANFWYQQSFHGIDLSPLRDDAVNEYFRQPIVDTFDVRILMAKSVKHTVNFLTAKEEDLHRIEIPLRFTAHTSGTVHGLAFWFDMAFVGTIATIWLSTAPTEALTHWYQVRCLLRSPLFIKAGEVLVGKVLLRSNKRQSYDIDIEAMVESTRCKSENTLDLKNPFFHYNGQSPSAPPGNHTVAPSDPYSSGMVSGTAAYDADSNGVQQQQQQLPSNNVQQGNLCYQQMLDPTMQNYPSAQCNVVPLLTGGSIPHPGTMAGSAMKSTMSGAVNSSQREQTQQYNASSPNQQQYVHY